MSEPTGDGKQQPDPERQPDDSSRETQDQASQPVANDPTAPLWSDPTAPTSTTSPTPPTPPMPPMPAAGTPSAWVPDAPPASNPYAPPVSNPYDQQTPAPPYAAPPAPPYGQQYPAYGQQPYGTGVPTAPSNTSAIVLTIVSAVSMLSTAFFVGVPSLIFGIMALTSNNTDPAGSRKKSKIGWIIYGVNIALIALAVVAIVAIVFIASDSGSSNFNSGY